MHIPSREISQARRPSPAPGTKQLGGLKHSQQTPHRKNRMASSLLNSKIRLLPGILTKDAIPDQLVLSQASFALATICLADKYQNSSLKKL